MKKNYKHLSVEERDHLSVLKGKGLSLRAISRALKRSPSTLSRELKRNAPPIRSGYYLSHRAHQRYVLRNQQRARRLRLKTKRIRAYVRRQLKRGWSPELISGRLGHLQPKQTIGCEAIYQWVYAEATDLIPCLVRHHRRRLCFGHSRRPISQAVFPSTRGPKSSTNVSNSAIGKLTQWSLAKAKSLCGPSSSVKAVSPIWESSNEKPLCK